MIKLQNNFTTPEQSKRLLELGVPADSADCYYQDYGSIPMVVWTLTQPRDLRIGVLKPCWSVGRLMEICSICSIWPFPNEINITRRDVDFSIVETLVNRFEELANYYSLNFSKLEE